MLLDDRGHQAVRRALQPVGDLGVEGHDANSAAGPARPRRRYPVSPLRTQPPRRRSPASPAAVMGARPAGVVAGDGRQVAHPAYGVLPSATSLTSNVGDIQRR
ncbi:hypothetical protein GCM10027612_39480 [Microbispora bryophytorum subsp. camponoti]